ncbi:hypothetical protein N9L68_01670 [bacterium]|nr:hypothetical protein [bacterium]
MTDSTMRRPAKPIISVFNPETYKKFVNTSRPVQFVMPLGNIGPQLELVYSDDKRRKRSCLIESTEEWPVFGAHGQICDTRSTFAQKGGGDKTIGSHIRDSKIKARDAKALASITSLWPQSNC